MTLEEMDEMCPEHEETEYSPTPPPPVRTVTGEILDGEETEAYRKIAGSLTEEFAPVNKCPQCGAVSIAEHCARCKNRPKMLKVGKIAKEISLPQSKVFCTNFQTTWCPEKIKVKANWCKWCKENYKEVEDEEDDDFEDDLDIMQDKLDKSLALLFGIKQLMVYLSDPEAVTVLQPPDRKEMQNFVTAIDELVVLCGFEDETDVQSESDKALLANLQEETDNQALDRMLDRIHIFS